MEELLKLGEHYGLGLVVLLWALRELAPWARSRLSRAQDAAIEERRARLARLALLDDREAAALDKLIDQVLARLDLSNKIQDSTRSELREIFVTNFSNAATVITGLQIDVRQLVERIEQLVDQLTERPNGRAPP